MSGPVQRSRFYLGHSLVVEHQPVSGHVRETAILLLPPMGYEDTCAYRPLRVLADQLAREGHLVQRLDWPGLGDSAGNAETPDLLHLCITTVLQAAAALRARGLRRSPLIAAHRSSARRHRKLSPNGPGTTCLGVTQQSVPSPHLREPSRAQKGCSASWLTSKAMSR